MATKADCSPTLFIRWYEIIIIIIIIVVKTVVPSNAGCNLLTILYKCLTTSFLGRS